MIEYLANPGETAALFTTDGFSKSGDLGVMDDDGFVRVTGRTKDIIIRGGMNISVREIEELCAPPPRVAGASRWSACPTSGSASGCAAIVVAKPGHEPPTVDDLREFLLARGHADPEDTRARDRRRLAADDRDRQGPQARAAHRHRTTPQSERRQSREVAGAP